MTDLIENNIKDRIENLLKYMNKNLYGKEEAVRLALLCAVAGESCFFMGPPGTAKSMISRRVQKVFKGGTTYFEYLMNEFTTPDEICGPVSLKNLENDVYKRMTEGFLPNANIAFLDEIWKSGPAILNTLLTIINEKIYHNGNEKIEVPLKALIAASNEFPAKGRGLEALWDRFVVRVKVDGVKSKTDFFKLVDSVTADLEIPEDLKISLEELDEWKKKIDKIYLSDTAKDIIVSTRKMMSDKNKEDEREDDEKYYVSDRRWKKIVHLLKASAFLNGRCEVLKTDCALIRYCIWGTEKQHDEVKREMNSILNISGWAKESIKSINESASLSAIKGKIAVYENRTHSSSIKFDLATTWYEGKEYYICIRCPAENWEPGSDSWARKSHDGFWWFFPVGFEYIEGNTPPQNVYEFMELFRHLQASRSKGIAKEGITIYKSLEDHIDASATKIALPQSSFDKKINIAFFTAEDRPQLIVGDDLFKEYRLFFKWDSTRHTLKFQNKNLSENDLYCDCKEELEKIIESDNMTSSIKNIFADEVSPQSKSNKYEAKKLLERLESAKQQHLSSQEQQKIDKDLDLIWKK